MRANFDVLYWLHYGETQRKSQPMSSRTKNRSWYLEPVTFSSFNSDIGIIVSRIEETETDLTANYSHWLDIGSALAQAFGERGRTYYHRISRFNTRFSPDRCNIQYDTCLKGKGPIIALNTFFHLVKQAGLILSDGGSNLRIVPKDTVVLPMNEPAVSVIIPEDPANDDLIFDTVVLPINEPAVSIAIPEDPANEGFIFDTVVLPMNEPAVSALIPEDPANDDLIFNTPQLPVNIYSQLPEILMESCLLFEEGIEQDVFLISSLTVLSGCLPNIEGTYFDESYSAHLFTFITAPAGSGKGKMNWAKYFGQAIHTHLTKRSDLKRKAYELNIEKYYNLTKAQRLKVEKPIEPPHEMFFLPGNSSSAAFIQALADNNYRAIIFETEADTLANTLKQEWGNFSDVLRKGFHHESTSMFRKKDNKCIEIKNPHIALCLGGTPNQVHRLMPDIENGLFSRILFYAFEDHSAFKNPFISHCAVNYAEFLTEKGNQIFEFYNQLTQLAQPIQFKLTSEQGHKFTALFGAMLSRNELLIGRDFNANIKRLGLITFRIAMIFTALRLLEASQLVTSQPSQLVTPGHLLSKHQGEKHTEQVTGSHQLSGNTLICSDRDYETAIIIAATLEKHAIAVYQNMPNTGLKGTGLTFFEKLPQQFDRQGYLKVAQELGIQPKTAERYIAQFKPRLLNHEYNLYTKILK